MNALGSNAPSKSTGARKRKKKKKKVVQKKVMENTRYV